MDSYHGYSQRRCNFREMTELITKNCENAHFGEKFIFFHPICMEMYVFDGKSRKLIEIHILGENNTIKLDIL